MPTLIHGSKYVRVNMGTPTAGVNTPATWRGNSLLPHTVVPAIPNTCFDARGRGIFPLSQPGRFPRGSRMSGRRGTVDMWITTGAAGADRTIGYLTDDTVQVRNGIAIRIDADNRPRVTWQVTRPVTAATGTLTATGDITDTETVSIDGKIYTIQDVLTNVDGHVLKGVTVGDTLDNLIAAIGLGAGAGVLYAAATTAHPSVTADRGAGDTMVVTAKTLGVMGNIIPTVTTALAAIWSGPTLDGGVAGLEVIGSVLPSYPVIPASTFLNIRLVWDIDKPIAGRRYMAFLINGMHVPGGDWSVNPITSWRLFQPRFLVLAGHPVAGEAEFNGSIDAVQLSEVVTMPL